MSKRDDHSGSHLTYPNYRHHLRQRAKIRQQIQHYNRLRGTLHNHPSGDPTPSRADIEMTRTIIDTAKPLGIAVHDHIIIGKTGHVSMKGVQLI